MNTLTNNFQGSSRKDLAFRNVCGRHVFENGLCLENTISVDGNLGNRWSLQYGYNEDIAFPCHLNLVEVFGLREFADDLRRGSSTHCVTYTYWQQIVDYSGRNTLIAIDDDVGYYKFLSVEGL